MARSIKNRILFWFISFSLIILVLISLLNGNYYNQKEQKNELIRHVTILENELLRLFNNSDAFFRNEVSNPDFFNSGESVYIHNHNQIISLTLEKLKQLRMFSSSQKVFITSETDTLFNYITEYNFLFQQIIGLILERGYKDYGTIGNMRDEIHKLENLPRIDQTKVLMLRRHEKDYIIRNEEQYIQKLFSLAESFKLDVINSKAINKKQKDSVFKILDNYKLLFSEVVSLDRQIGIRDNTSMKKQLDGISIDIENHIGNIVHEVTAEQLQALKRARVIFLTEIVLVILLSFLFSLFIRKRLTNSLYQLSDYISNLKKNELKGINKSFITKADTEVLNIYHKFNQLVDHLAAREKQRDQAINSLKIQELRFRQIADLLPVSLFEASSDGSLEYINKRFKDSFGYPVEDYEHLKIQDIMPDEKFLNKLFRYRNLDSFETYALKYRGQRFPVLVFTSSVNEKTKENGIRGVILDITERVKIINDLKNAKQQAEESDKLKSAFLANMSHEVRTPMNAIIGFTDLLSDYIPEDETALDYINQIQNSGRLLLNIIDDIIDISTIEAGRINIQYETINLNQLFEEISNHYQNEIKKNRYNIRIVPEKGSQDPLLIKTDPYRLRQILINLLSNALKFTHEGFIHFGYVMENNCIRFYVRDTGIGIASEKLEMIFERFRQADENLNRKYGGTGLGLAISKNLVELLGGKIYAESEEGKGSHFFFTLPCDSVQTADLTESFVQPNTDIKEYFWEHRTVLIAEDDFVSMHYLLEILKPTRINIIHATNGNEAIEKFKNNMDIDIVLMDIHMPVMNGYDTTRKIKQINKNIPVIAQTAYAMADEKKMCLAAGCNDYLPKPVKRDFLFQIMEKYLGTGKQAGQDHMNKQISKKTV